MSRTMDTWSSGNKKWKKLTVLLSYPVSPEELEKKNKFLEVHKQVFLLLLLLFPYIPLLSHQYLRRIAEKEYLLSRMHPNTEEMPV